MARLTILQIFLPVVLLALSIPQEVAAQDTPPTPTVATEPAARAQPAPPVTRDTLENLILQLIAGQQEIQPLIDAVDVTVLESWLSESPLERLQELAAQDGLSDAERTVWQQAVEQEQAGAERIRGALNRANLATSGITRLQTSQARIETLLEQADNSSADPDRTLSQIEEDMSSLNTRRTQVSIELSQRRQTLTQLDEQVRNQAATLEQLSREEETELASLEDEDTSGSEATAEALAALRTAQVRRVQARLIAAQLDAQVAPARLARLRIEITANETEERWLGQRLSALQAEFNFRSTEELRALNRGIQELTEREPQFTEQNAGRLTALRTQIDSMEQMQARIRELQQDREQYQRLETDLGQTLANIEERLEIGGLTETLGSLFLEEQRRLQSLDDSRLSLQQIERELSTTRLRNITLREQLNLMDEPFESTAGESADAEMQRLEYEILSALVVASESLSDQLRQSEVQLRSLLAVVDELDQILTETLLWWPSHLPVSVEWSKRIPNAIVAAVSVDAWAEIRRAFLDITWRGPAGSLLTLLLVLGLYRVGLGYRREMAKLTEKTQHRFTDSIVHTFKALGWTLLRVIPIPVLLGITSWRLKQVGAGSPNIELLSDALISAAMWWTAAHFTLLFTNKAGVGLNHFDWKPFFIGRLRRNLSWYAPIQFVLIIAMALVLTHPNELVFDVFGRLGLVAVGLLSLIFFWRLLGISAETTLPPAADRQRRLIRLILLLLSVGVVVLSLMGYLLTARQLLLRILDTIFVLSVIWLGYQTASRMLVLSEIRLRVRRAREERTKAAAMENTVIGGEGLDIPEPHLSVDDINQQTRSLVNVTTGGVVVLALFWVWADILPALTWLDSVTLWTRSIVEGDVEILSLVSLQDILLAGFLTVIFSLASKNLPGLVEILLSRGTNLDAAARYTATTLLRYLMLVVLVISVFSLFGLRWSELQWMVAALTLGLGFGMQEVVANFVSGLIVLFERPIRVGDTITIAEYSGTVSRIRTRATTIIDWDNKEIVVPNKNFITERLINWSLSDTITRVIVKVGVSYESDVELVMKTLAEAAAANELVLKDPPPVVLFMQLGDSTLNFELRIYVSQLRERLVASSQLHCTIMQRFRELGIEIAFPQLDLHVRDMAPFETAIQRDNPTHQGSGRERTRVEDQSQKSRDSGDAGEDLPPESDR